ncbi:MAG TPA: TraC family protein [Pseudomonadales bacterium]|nr:TraC family protein [Pseudomonadales bacterium]
MFDQSPNGFFINDLIVFNTLNAGGYVSKGFVFEPPDLVNAQVSDLNQFQDQLSLLLASLNEQQRLQIQYFCDSDYRRELLRYQEETQKAENLWTRRSRNERFGRYWQLMLERRLRRQRLVFYLSRKIETSSKGIKSEAALKEYYTQVLSQLKGEFEHTHEMLAEIFSGQGARIIPMKDADHFRHYKTFLNPSLAERFDYDPIETFDPELTIQENCWHSEGSGQADFGFFMDGNYHSLIVLSRWPKATYPGMIHRLTGLRLLDYTITVNLDPLSVRREINKEEKEHDRIAGDFASENKLSLLTVMEKKQKKIAALMQGHTFPFKVLFAIRAWDKTKDGLIAKTTAIKNAINSMNGAQYSESNLPSTSKKLFYMTWPGWTWGHYDARKLYGENRYIADLLPIASTFTGHLDTAEAIYEGPNQNLVGIKTFSGASGNQSPQHAVLLGMSGAGKSVTICDLLSQTENYFAYTVIIEEGLSYGIYTQTVEPEAKPIIVQPDGDITINYLDTKGLPLTPDHLASATALVARMVGFSQSEDKQMLRQAQIAKYVNLLYEDVFQDWSRKNESLLMQVAHHACALAHYRKEKMPPGATMLEAFADFRDHYGVHEPKGQEYLSQFSEGEILKFLKDPGTTKEVRNVAFAYFKTAEYPTHRMLQELMSLDASGAEREQIIEIATLLLPWCRDGNFGALFDGPSNLSLTGKIAHFELGYIPDSAKELRAAAGFLITNHARKHIITLPRALRKRNVYEEVARFLDIPGGEEIVKESYAQLRKFNCWNISIVQQYARFKQSRIRSAVFGNSRQFFLMRQNDRSDLDDIARDIAIPEITKHTIMNYTLPDHQAGAKYSAFTYLHVDSNRPVCGTAYNYTSPEMLYCSSSSGEHFEKRAKELRGAPNIVEGILTYSRQPQLKEAA